MPRNQRTKQEKRRQIAVEPEVEEVEVGHEDVADLEVVVDAVAGEDFEPLEDNLRTIPSAIPVQT
jgi:hypothetical protein